MEYNKLTKLKKLVTTSFNRGNFPAAVVETTNSEMRETTTGSEAAAMAPERTAGKRTRRKVRSSKAMRSRRAGRKEGKEMLLADEPQEADAVDDWSFVKFSLLCRCRGGKEWRFGVGCDNLEWMGVGLVAIPAGDVWRDGLAALGVVEEKPLHIGRVPRILTVRIAESGCVAAMVSSGRRRRCRLRHCLVVIKVGAMSWINETFFFRRTIKHGGNSRDLASDGSTNNVVFKRQLTFVLIPI